MKRHYVIHALACPPLTFNYEERARWDKLGSRYSRNFHFYGTFSESNIRGLKALGDLKKRLGKMLRPRGRWETLLIIADGKGGRK
jgi:hypothetical protein